MAYQSSRSKSLVFDRNWRKWIRTLFHIDFTFQFTLVQQMSMECFLPIGLRLRDLRIIKISLLVLLLQGGLLSHKGMRLTERAKIQSRIRGMQWVSRSDITCLREQGRLLRMNRLVSIHYSVYKYWLKEWIKKLIRVQMLKTLIY